METRPRTPWLKYLLSLAVAAALLYVSFRGVKWADLLAALGACRWGFVLLAMAVGALAFLLRALRWQMLLRPIDPSLRLLPVVNAINISYLANLVLPRIGEFVRCGYITKHSLPGPDGVKRASYDKTLGTVVADRLWDMLSLFLLTLVLLGLFWSRFGGFFRERILTPVSGNAGHTGLMLAGAVLVAAALLWLVWRLRERSVLCGKVWGFVAGMGTGLRDSLRMQHFWLFLLLTVLVWACYWMQCQAIVWAVDNLLPEGVRLGPGDALILMVVGALSSLVPVPGGFGAFHYLVSLALTSLYGIPMETAVIFATLSHESQVLTQILCGGASYAAESFTH